MSGSVATAMPPCALLRIYRADMSEPREFPPRRSAKNAIDVIPRRILALHVGSYDKEGHAVRIFRHVLDAARHHIGLKLGEHSLYLGVHGAGP